MLFCCVGRKRFWGAALCLALAVMGGLAVVRALAVQKKDFIRWVDFTPTHAALSAALEEDLRSHREQGEEQVQPVDWVELLACLGARYGGDFSRYRDTHLRETAKALSQGKSPKSILGKGPDQYYDYYREAYGAVLENMVGNYLLEEPDPNDPEHLIQTAGYGLTAFCPIARGYGFSHYDDFGAGRSYGYRRKHLGNDLMAPVGTPVVAVEGGVVEAGQVIGYVGMTGYSSTPDTNGMSAPHLHFGLQLIFDESQKEGNNEIWVDVYPLVNLLERRRATVVPGEEKGEYRRKYRFTPVD